MNAFEAAGLTPPTLAELSKQLDATPGQVSPVVELCVDEGYLTRLGDGQFLHRDRVADVRCQLEGELRDRGGLTVSEIKAVLGISRKYAVPICEHLDRIGFTRRVGDRRVLADQC